MCANAVADRVDFVDTGLEAFVHGKKAPARFQAQEDCQGWLVLADCFDDLIRFKQELGARNSHWRWTARGIRRA